MKNSTLLTLIGIDSTPEQLSPLFEEARMQSTHLAVLVVGVAPRFPISAYGAPPYGPIVIADDWQKTYTEGRAEVTAKVDEIEALLSKHDVSGDVGSVFGQPIELKAAVVARAMVCDLAWITQDLRVDDVAFSQVTHGLLLSSPLGVVLNDTSAAPPLSPAHVMIAWNTSLHASRAVHAARPLLKDAKEITIVCVDPVMKEGRDGEDPGADLAKWLSHMGCKVTVQQDASGGKEVGTSLLERAKSIGADMIVMGAYGHSRMQQAVFGGTTRTMIEQEAIPVLLAH